MVDLSYRMPFEHFEDKDTIRVKNIIATTTGKRRRRSVALMTPEKEYRSCMYTSKHSEERWLVPYSRDKRNRIDAYLARGYKTFDALGIEARGTSGYVLCPGPSIGSFDVQSVENLPAVFAVNSAGFVAKSATWCVIEATYSKWLSETRRRLRLVRHRKFVMSARAAIWSPRLDVYLSRFEERRNIPTRCSAPGLFAAVAAAWSVGCTRVYLIGVDLSKKNGAYVDGVPYSAEGAESPFDDQLRAVPQMAFPGVEIINGSPVSRDSLPFTYASYEDIASIARMEEGRIREVPRAVPEAVR